jgi:hypothetical protein
VKYFEMLRRVISVNDGKRKCGDSIIQVSSSQPPFNSTQKTQMTVADATFDITNIDKSYALVDVSCFVRAHDLTASINDTTDPNHLLKVFIGFKNSNEAVRETNMTSNGSETGYKSNTIQYESFAYSNVKSESEKQRKRGIHTTYSNVKDYSQSVCGAYVDLADFKGGAETVEVRFQMCIPFTDLLVFSFFSYLGKFPSFLANIIMKDIYLGHHALVWALCSPKEVADVKMFMEDVQVDSNYPDLSTIQYEHRFQQIDDPGFVPISARLATAQDAPIPVGSFIYTSGEATFSCVSMRINEWKSHIKGYMISDAAKHEIAGQISEMGGLVFPSQECQYIQFNNGPTAKGLRIQVNTALFNTNSIIVGFPKTPHQITVLQNPSLVGCQLKLNGQFIPNEGFDTHSVAHLQDQVSIANLDGPLNCTKDFENSIMLEHNRPIDPKLGDLSGKRWENALTDDTSYLCQFQTERSDAAFVVDGINSGGKNVPIELVALPKFPGDLDCYYIPKLPAQGEATEYNQMKPFMLEVRDTFFVLDHTGLHYKGDKVPRGSQADPAFED